MVHVTHHQPPARHWQDWANMALGAAMAASPWLFQYRGLDGATLNALIVGLLVFALSALALTLLDGWEAYISAALGLWLIIAPWMLGFAGYDGAKFAHLGIGAAVLAVAAWNIWRGSRDDAAAEA